MAVHWGIATSQKWPFIHELSYDRFRPIADI